AVVFTNFVDLDNVGMLQTGDSFSLAAKTLDDLAAGMAAGENHLERHQAIEAELPRLVDHAHAAAAQFLENLVTRDDAPAGAGRRTAAASAFADRGRPCGTRGAACAQRTLTACFLGARAVAELGRRGPSGHLWRRRRVGNDVLHEELRLDLLVKIVQQFRTIGTNLGRGERLPLAAQVAPAPQQVAQARVVGHEASPQSGQREDTLPFGSRLNHEAPDLGSPSRRTRIFPIRNIKPRPRREKWQSPAFGETDDLFLAG